MSEDLPTFERPIKATWTVVAGYWLSLLLLVMKVALVISIVFVLVVLLIGGKHLFDVVGKVGEAIGKPFKEVDNVFFLYLSPLHDHSLGFGASIW